jgi:hypothetical protein
MSLPREVVVTLWTALHGVASLQVVHPGTLWPESMLEDLLDRLTYGLIPR